MNKSEALDVLHEIYDTLNQYSTVTCVTLDPELLRLGDNYQIRIKCHLDSTSQQYIENILAKHQLAMKEEKGFRVIFKIHSIN